MLRLSRNEIEDIAVSVLHDYAIQTAVTERHLPVDIEDFAQKYLGMRVQYRRLSDDGSLLGLTTRKDVQVKLTYTDRDVIISVSEDSILIDDTLYRKRRGRFTVAHECAHQVLTHVEERHTGTSFRKAFKPGKLYSVHELNLVNEWREWQANTLGAALLMPRMEIHRRLRGFRPVRFTAYGSRFNPMEYRRIKDLADNFDVSMSAMTLRLKELGFIDCKLESEYYDPRDIFCGVGDGDET